MTNLKLVLILFAATNLVSYFAGMWRARKGGAS